MHIEQQPQTGPYFQEKKRNSPKIKYASFCLLLISTLAFETGDRTVCNKGPSDHTLRVSVNTERLSYFLQIFMQL